MNCRSYWKTRWSGCGAESHPAIFKYCWMREMTNVHWLGDGGKYSVRVPGPMEKDQLTVQREAHLGCWSVARRGCLGREIDCKSMLGRCTHTQELSYWRHCKNKQVDQAAKVKLPQVDYFWLSGQPVIPHDIWKEMQHYRWAHDYGVDLTVDTVSRLSLAVKHVLKSSRAK